ncbi:MAG: BREX-2 system phosphatase PglZ [Polyangiaceae bacterium]
MMVTPELSSTEVEQILKEVTAQPRKRYLVAIHGTAKAETTVGEFDVIPVRSELELRERMPVLQRGVGDTPKIAFLVPWSTQIPADIAGRFAKSGRVLPAGSEVRLRALFHAKELDERVTATALARYLLRQSKKPEFDSRHSRLTLETLWSSWLGARWGLPDGELALDALLGWAARDNRGTEFVESMAEPEAVGVRDELLDLVEKRLGAAGVLVWRSWEKSEGKKLLQYALLFEPLRLREEAVARTWQKSELKHAFGVTDGDEALAVAGELGRVSQHALRLYEQAVSEKDAQVLLRSADERVTDDEIRSLLEQSTRLPSAWKLRLSRLGSELQAGASEPTAERVAAAVGALRALESHVSFRDPEQTQTVRRADMAVRLLAWLGARPDQKLDIGPAPHAAVEVLAGWYADEGGFVDRARRLARGESDSALGRGAHAVVHAADQARVELDRRFANALAAWHQAGRPATAVLPIEQAVKRVAVRFLDEHPERRLLVLLMDGMAWAQATEILQALGTWSSVWGPLAWQQHPKHRIGRGIHVPMLAALPTLTEVSRAAFFAGKPPKPGSQGATSEDVARWSNNTDIAPFVQTQSSNELLLRADGHAADGHASNEALARVEDKSRRLVAMVINAIDSSLKGDPQHYAEWRADSIKSLPALLDKARDVGRAVLLVADHGHVPADCFSSSAGAMEKPGGARWRAWSSPSAPINDGEVGFAGSAIAAPKGAHGVVLLADDTQRYGGGAHAGEHGGATLAEVVAPCVLIGAAELEDQLRDPALRATRPYEPEWWHPSQVVVEARVRTSTPVPPPVAATAKKPKPRPQNEAQLAMTGILPPEEAAPAPVAPAAGPSVAAGPDMQSAFALCEMLKARAPSRAQREKVVRAVEFLRERAGVASAQAFAKEMSEFDYRIDGLISGLQEVLNVEGYAVLRFERNTHQVHLDMEKLEQQFEVKL